MRHPLITAVSSTTVGLAAAVALPVGAASAESVRITDPAGDVRTWSADEAGDESVVDAPGAQPDLTAVTVRHRPRVVELDIATTGIDRFTDDAASVDFLVRMQGSNGQSRVLYLGASAELPGGRSNDLVRARNGERVCAGAVTSRLDYATGRMFASVPRRCLDAPARVRAGVQAYYTEQYESGPTQVDNAHQVGGDAETLGKPYLGTGFTRYLRRG